MASLAQRLRSGMAVSYAILARRSSRWTWPRPIPSIQSRFFHPNVQLQGQAGLGQSPEAENSPVKEGDNLGSPPLSSGLPGDAPRAYARPKFATRSYLPRALDPQHEQMLDDSPKRQEAPLYHRGSLFDRVAYWQNIPRWKDATEKEFLTYSWSIANDVQGEDQLCEFLSEVLPEKFTPNEEKYEHIRTRDSFIQDVREGIKLAPMSIRLPPHILACIDWNNPLEDPLRRQFIPMKAAFELDHPKSARDPLHEEQDYAVRGLVHRYTDKVLFLALTHCPLYCRSCTRAHNVGANTSTVKKYPLKPTLKRWNAMLDYIRRTPSVKDVVVSGGDCYSLLPDHLALIGNALLSIPNVQRFRIATKGLCGAPSRILDIADGWTEELIKLSAKARKMGKSVAMHTHFNHPNEFTWVSREAAQRLYENGVTVRNQAVLLKGVNDSVETMGKLIRELADNNIQPYYVYAGDMVPGAEDLRTPLQTILDLEEQLRGTIGGFVFPQFVVDLPGGGGKRLAASYTSYDRKTGRSTFVAPSVKGGEKVYEYWDPLTSLSEGGVEEKTTGGHDEIAGLPTGSRDSLEQRPEAHVIPESFKLGGDLGRLNIS